MDLTIHHSPFFVVLASSGRCHPARVRQGLGKKYGDVQIEWGSLPFLEDVIRDPHQNRDFGQQLQ
jgi:hypothetical protein